jgi:serine protease Do
MPKGREIMTGQGSGFFVSADGYAVTNNHVVDNAESVDVTTSDGTIYHAKVVGTNRKTDFALIKVDGAGNFPSSNLLARRHVSAIGPSRSVIRSVSAER